MMVCFFLFCILCYVPFVSYICWLTCIISLGCVWLHTCSSALYFYLVICKMCMMTPSSKKSCSCQWGGTCCLFISAPHKVHGRTYYYDHHCHSWSETGSQVVKHPFSYHLSSGHTEDNSQHILHAKDTYVIVSHRSGYAVSFSLILR